MITNTVSLELAKELWELGLKIETEKWWNAHDRIDLVTNTAYSDNYLVEDKRRWDIGDNSHSYSSYPAPQTDELLAVLPKHLDGGVMHIYPTINGYGVRYKEGFGEGLYYQQGDNLSEALGLMCKYLLTNDYEFNGKEIVRKGN